MTVDLLCLYCNHKGEQSLQNRVLQHTRIFFKKPADMWLTRLVSSSGQTKCSDPNLSSYNLQIYYYSPLSRDHELNQNKKITPKLGYWEITDLYDDRNSYYYNFNHRVANLVTCYTGWLMVWLQGVTSPWDNSRKLLLKSWLNFNDLWRSCLAQRCVGSIFSDTNVLALRAPNQSAASGALIKF
jgi:hypothetical protein